MAESEAGASRSVSRSESGPILIAAGSAIQIVGVIWQAAQ
jgi:hypothetical protein